MPELSVSWFLGIVIAVLTSGVGGYFYGAHVEKLADLAKASTEVVEQAVKVEKVESKQNQISQTVGNDYEKTINSIRSNFNGLRVKSNSSSLSTVSSSPCGSNGSPANDLFTEQCSITTAQLVALQKWVEQQQQVKE